MQTLSLCYSPCSNITWRLQTSERTEEATHSSDDPSLRPCEDSYFSPFHKSWCLAAVGGTARPLGFIALAWTWFCPEFLLHPYSSTPWAGAGCAPQELKHKWYWLLIAGDLRKVEVWPLFNYLGQKHAIGVHDEGSSAGCGHRHCLSWRAATCVSSREGLHLSSPAYNW